GGNRAGPLRLLPPGRPGARPLGRPGGEATPGRLRGVRVRAGPTCQQGTLLFRRRAVAYGFLPSRPRDFAGFGLAYGSYSGDLRRAEEVQALTDPAVGVQSWEMTLEWTYGCTVKPGLLVQPSLQYLVNPGGNKAVPNALAIGANVV